MPAGYSYRIGHCHHSQAERQENTQKTNAEVRVVAAIYCAAAAANASQNVATGSALPER